MPVMVAGAVTLVLFALPPTAQAPFATTILAQTTARLAVCPAPADLIQNNVRVESLQQTGDGFGIFYSASCLGDGITAPLAGFLVYQRAGLSWNNLGGEDVSFYDAGCMTSRIAGQKVCCMVSNGDEGAYTAVFGLVLAANVKFVEIAFADGEVLRSSIVDHRFAIGRPRPMNAGILRALAADGRVIDVFPLDLSAGAQVRGTTGCRA